MKTNTYALQCALLASALTLSTTLSAESTQSSSTTTERRATATTSTESNLDRNDRNFLEKAVQSGLKEVDVSQSVVNRLTNPQVKQFAEMMVTEHSRANAELMSLAAAKGVTAPAKESKFAEKWSKKTDELDEDYMEEMVEDHENAVKLYEKASKSEDAEIAAFARKTLPKLQQHFAQAKELEKLVD
jgi:putative membrane protein